MPGMPPNPRRTALAAIYQAALAAVDPAPAVVRFLSREGDTLKAGERRYPLNRFRKVFLAGAGKAGVPMAEAVEEVVGDALERGLIVVKHRPPDSRLTRTEVLEAGHPEPDQAGVEAASCLIEFLAANLTRDDLLLLAISGGGSALLPSPVPAISFEDKKLTTRILLRCGATIQEMNAIRKHLSRLKGGRLLDFTADCTVIAMLLSDVVGDDLAAIASGPTSPDPTTFQDCLDVIQRYRIQSDLPGSVLPYLTAGAGGFDPEIRETPKAGDPRFEQVQNAIVASNILALRAAAQQARREGFEPLILSSSIYGNTADLARFMVAIAREVLRSNHPLSPPCCLIGGGETTVRVEGDGKGGRNQEWALWCARECASWGETPVLFASLGSDGNDGPTDAAGAIATPRTARRAERMSLSIEDHLRRNDSYHFFQPLQDLIVTGPTQTNVMDLQLVLIGEPKPPA